MADPTRATKIDPTWPGSKNFDPVPSLAQVHRNVIYSLIWWLSFFTSLWLSLWITSSCATWHFLYKRFCNCPKSKEKKEHENYRQHTLCNKKVNYCFNHIHARQGDATHTRSIKHNITNANNALKPKRLILQYFFVFQVYFPCYLF